MLTRIACHLLEALILVAFVTGLMIWAAIAINVLGP
jgi:hypothetical protein